MKEQILKHISSFAIPAIIGVVIGSMWGGNTALGNSMIKAEPQETAPAEEVQVEDKTTISDAYTSAEKEDKNEESKTEEKPAKTEEKSVEKPANSSNTKPAATTKPATVTNNVDASNVKIYRNSNGDIYDSDRFPSCTPGAVYSTNQGDKTRIVFDEYCHLRPDTGGFSTYQPYFDSVMGICPSKRDIGIVFENGDPIPAIGINPNTWHGANGRMNLHDWIAIEWNEAYRPYNSSTRAVSKNGKISTNLSYVSEYDGKTWARNFDLTLDYVNNVVTITNINGKTTEYQAELDKAAAEGTAYLRSIIAQYKAKCSND